MIKKRIKRALAGYFHKSRMKSVRKTFDRQVDIRLSNMKNVLVDEAREKAYQEKWRSIDPQIRPTYYRVYRNLSGTDSLDYIPDYLYYTFIEPQLNNYRYSVLGEEKNYYDKLFKGVHLPLTLLRNINGMYLDRDYNILEMNDRVLYELAAGHEALFIKPTLVTGQGKNVMRFVRKGDKFFSLNNEELSVAYLASAFGSDFIVQENLPQSEKISRFNRDSINTLRILTYKSVTDNKVHVLHTTLRVGMKGSIIDASRAGGRFCGVNEDGSLIPQVYDSKGNRYEDFNGLKITDASFSIPNFPAVLELAKRSSEQIHHHRVLALDVMIDDQDQPRLIEVNPLGQGMFIFQATIGPMFREFTQEVISYCEKNRANYFATYTLEL